MFDYFLLFMSYLILILCVLIGVGFFTLFEPKILGYIQISKGPNKVGYMGLFQPFSDAINLFCKEQAKRMMSNFFSYYFSPVFNFFLSLFSWLCLPFFSGFIKFSLAFLFFLCVSSVSVYMIMMAGWSSNSNYSLLGSLRCMAQTISYEVSLGIILLSFLFIFCSISIFDLTIYQNYIWFILFSLPLSMIWFVSSLAETNRTPFDFAEGESELVSGFNVEYSGGGFALIFMGEYASILFMSMMFVFLFLSRSMTNKMFFFMVLFISFCFIWVRGTFRRFRFDKLMFLAWKAFFPISLNFLMFFFGLKMLIFSLIF
nr:NADH dehydrogenase subunit 1 [Abscondita chinensis]